MYSKYREQDLKTHPVKRARVPDYRGFGLERFHCIYITHVYIRMCTYVCTYVHTYVCIHV